MRGNDLQKNRLLQNTMRTGLLLILTAVGAALLIAFVLYVARSKNRIKNKSEPGPSAPTG